jgi:hypothetical protein
MREMHYDMALFVTRRSVSNVCFFPFFETLKKCEFERFDFIFDMIEVLNCASLKNHLQPLAT